MSAAIVAAIVSGGAAPVLEIMIGTAALAAIGLLAFSERDETKAQRALGPSQTDNPEGDVGGGSRSVATSPHASAD